MTRKVVTARSTETLETAASRMVGARVSGLPVIGPRGTVVGIISQKDVLRLLGSRAGLTVPRTLFELFLAGGEATPTDVATACRRLLANARVREGMSRPAITARPSTPLDEAIGLLITNRINRLPVVEAGRLVGIVTRTDLLTGVHGAR